MQQIYLVIALAIICSSMVTGFIIFRMQGMKLAVHFGTLACALLVTLAALGTGIPAIIYVALLLQVLSAVTAYTQVWSIICYNFQTAPAYASHLALVTMLPVLAVAGLFL